MIELAGIIILGILAQWSAWRLKIPAILPLIIIGLLVGPIATEFTENHTKLIEPQWDGTRGLFPGESLYYFVSLAIGVILFEGGLTLKRSELTNVGPVITKLIVIGSLVTFVLGGIAAHYFFDLNWQISLLFSSLIVVTGPTVIAPILRNIPLKKDVSAVLKWEGILIDPIGALFAVLVYEFIMVGQGREYTLKAIVEFSKVLLFGLTFGFTFAHALAFLIKNKLIPHYLVNVGSLSMVLFVFVSAELFAHESGLLAVVVMGMVMGNMKVPNLDDLLYFKESLSILLISILFIILAANIDLEDLEKIYNWRTLALLGVIIFLIRPLVVLISSWGSNLTVRERMFISWVGPRGIVAAGIASLFGTRLADQGETGAEFVTPLVFMVVLGTVLLNAATARPVAKWLGVYLTKSEGILIVGASKLSRVIATYLRENRRDVVLIDNNQQNVDKARNMGLEAINANIFAESLTDNFELNDVGYMLALTGNSEINRYAVDRFGQQFGEHGAHRLMDQLRKGESPDGRFTPFDFGELSAVVRDYPTINEIKIENGEQLRGLLNYKEDKVVRVPLFVKKKGGALDVISSLDSDLEVEPGSKLVYLGKVYDFDEELVP